MTPDIEFRLVRAFLRLFVRLSMHVHVTGMELLPPSGGFILASNHLGRLDVPLVYAFTGRSDVFLLVAEKYQQNALLRWAFRHLNGIFVHRFNADFSALREALKRLQQGQVLAAAPEGTRSPTGALIEGRPGLSYLAAKAGVPVVPVGVYGTEDARVKAGYRRLRRPQVHIQVGEPFCLPDVRGPEREALLKQYTDEIMCRIAILLPPAYRGVYADHPRTLQLLGEQGLIARAS